METGSARLQLAIDLGSDPIAGSLQSPGRDPVRFIGWIDLVAAIEEARDTSDKTLGWVPGAKPWDRQLS
jgi:hypothetical protein